MCGSYTSTYMIFTLQNNMRHSFLLKYLRSPESRNTCSYDNNFMKLSDMPSGSYKKEKTVKVSSYK
jgi:hypothetical protein